MCTYSYPHSCPGQNGGYQSFLDRSREERPGRTRALSIRRPSVVIVGLGRWRLSGALGTQILEKGMLRTYLEEVA